jgi:enediyne biosynthesis protein E4
MTTTATWIGAKVKLTIASGVTQYNHVTTSVAYASSSTRNVHFGLGSENRASRIEIRWPSGIIQHLEKVAADQVVKVTETE